jgi:hypothetical protein
MTLALRIALLWCIILFTSTLTSKDEEKHSKHQNYTTGISRRVIENFTVKKKSSEKLLEAGMILKITNQIEKKTELNIINENFYRVIRILEGEDAEYYEIGQQDLDDKTASYTDYESQCPICMEDCPIMLLTKCKHKFCVQCLHTNRENRLEEQREQICPNCRTAIGNSIFFDFQFINVNVQFPEIFRMEILQFAFPFIFMLPEITRSVIQKWLAIDQEYIHVNTIAKINDGVTPLMIATFAGNLDMINFLLDQGADQSYLNDKKMGMLHMAAMTKKNRNCTVLS